jgi:hypothetical protein
MRAIVVAALIVPVIAIVALYLAVTGDRCQFDEA